MVDTATLFELLAADLRRQVLFTLCDSDPIHLPEGLLPRGQTQSSQAQNTHLDSLSGPASASERDEMHEHTIQLEHVHLPKLDEAGFIEWERDTDTIRRGPLFDKVEPVLQLLAANQHRFPDDLL